EPVPEARDARRAPAATGLAPGRVDGLEAARRLGHVARRREAHHGVGPARRARERARPHRAGPDRRTALLHALRTDGRRALEGGLAGPEAAQLRHLRIERREAIVE